METIHIHILQTNIQSPRERDFLLCQLKQIDDVQNASVDFADRDKVLRVECRNYTLQQVVNIVSNYGIWCRELPE